jgi:hypothetical protein
LELVANPEILWEIFLAKSRNGTAKVIFGKVRWLAVLAGEHSFADGRECDDGDPEFLGRVEKAIFLRVSVPGGVFDLKGVDLDDWKQG